MKRRTDRTSERTLRLLLFLICAGNVVAGPEDTDKQCSAPAVSLALCSDLITDREFRPEGKAAQLSGLVYLGDSEDCHEMLAVSDRGFVVKLEVRTGKDFSVVPADKTVPVAETGMESITRFDSDTLLVAIEDNDGSSHRIRNFDAKKQTFKPDDSLTKSLTGKAQLLRKDRGLESITRLNDSRVLVAAERLPTRKEKPDFYDQFTVPMPDHKWTSMWIREPEGRMKQLWYERRPSPVRHHDDRFCGSYVIKDLAQLPHSGDLLVLEHFGDELPSTDDNPNRDKSNNPWQDATAVRRIPLRELDRTLKNKTPKLNAPDPIMTIESNGPHDEYADVYEGMTVWEKDERSAWILLVADNGSGRSRATRFVLFECSDVQRQPKEARGDGS